MQHETTHDGTLEVLAIDAIEAGMLVWQSGVVYANDAAGQLLGVSSTEALQGPQSLEALFAPDSLRPVNRLLAKADGTCEAQVPQEGRAGSWLRVTARPTVWRGAAAVLLICTDISDQKAAQAALAQERHLLQQVLDSDTRQVTIKDTARRYTRVNAEMACYCGSTPGALVGHTNGEASVNSPTWRLLTAELDRHVLEQGQAVHAHNAVVPGSDGAERIWRISKYPLRNLEGELVGLLGQAEDVTEQVQAEEAVHRYQRLLQAVLDQVPLPITVKDLERRYLIVNRRMAAVWNITDTTAVIGKRLEDLSPSPREDQVGVVDMDRQVLETGQVVEKPELPFRTPDGNTVRWRVIQGPLRDESGRIVGIIGFAEDITTRVEAARDLTRMVDGLIRYANAAFERLTGYSRAEATGQTPRLLKSGLQGQDFYKGIWETLLRGEVWEGRYVNRRKDGTLYHTHAIHSPVRGSDGQVTAFLAVQRDISKQVELDERLLRSQRLEALGTLAGGIAHDFNNLLIPILGYTELMQGTAPPGSREANWLQIVADASIRARDLVERILLFTRHADARQHPMQLKPVVQEVVGLLSSALPPSTELRTDLRTDAPILSSPGQMHQVLMNLCVNAKQAMPEGGLLTIALDVADLSGLDDYVGQSLSGRYVHLAVSDTGQGMNEETLSRIFEPFYTTKPVGQGTGLGLSTVFGIVRGCGGDLRVQSSPGHGSTFDLYFPVAEPAADVTDSQLAPALPGFERVLVVDDQPAIADLVHDQLCELGYQVTTRTQAVEALALLEADPQAFDIVISDLAMPDLPGDVLAERLHTLNPRLPIVLFTGAGRLRALTDGVISAVLQKPFRAAELTALLRRLVQRAKSL